MKRESLYQGNILDIFLLVIVGDFNIPSSRLEVNSVLLTKDLILDGKVLENDVINIVLTREMVSQLRFSLQQAQVHSQHPSKSPEIIGIDTLHIRQCNLFPQNHLVECTNEECIQETSVENSKTDYPSNKLKVAKMLGVDAGVGVYLQSVIVDGRVFEKTVEGVEHFVRKEEEELSVDMLASRWL